MPRNIEIKARIESIEALAATARALADEGPIEISQDYTFFRCNSGRLKLREFADGTGELIYYHRPNLHGPKESFCLRSPAAAANSLREVLSLAFGQIGRVKKHRTLFLAGRTRIHLDRVDHLGNFLELEVVLADDESAAAGVGEAQELAEKLGITSNQLIEDAYVDLLARL
jgi:predicted adenylyl cyclase CyaB